MFRYFLSLWSRITDKMKKLLTFLLLFIMVSCGNSRTTGEKPTITVSIAPYKYFVDAIAGDNFTVNVMVPPGASPHNYEPYPEQIKKLQQSVAYIANGYLDFELAWMDRFYGMNPAMEGLTLADSMELIASSHIHSEGEHDSDEGSHDGAETKGADQNVVGVDAHFWLSPKRGLIIASEIKDFLCELDPPNSGLYQKNYTELAQSIVKLDLKADSLFSAAQKKTIIIYHPNLAYLAKDYGINELAIEEDGKEPSPAHLKELVDLARSEGIKSVFIQKEYDKRYAETIAGDIGAGVVVIDPLSANWLASTDSIIVAIYKSLTQ